MLSRAAKRSNTVPAEGRPRIPPAESSALFPLGPSGPAFLSVGRVTIEGMELTGRDFDKIPPRNLHVPVVDFARLWLASEWQYDQERTWAAYGVVETCRWLATATVRPDERPLANGRFSL